MDLISKENLDDFPEYMGNIRIYQQSSYKK